MSILLAESWVMESAINTEHAEYHFRWAYSLFTFGLLKKLALKGIQPILASPKIRSHCTCVRYLYVLQVVLKFDELKADMPTMSENIVNADRF